MSAADLGADYLATVHKSPVPLLTQSIGIVNGGALPSDEIPYRVLDAVVDSYLPVLEDDVEDVSIYSKILWSGRWTLTFSNG